jgi:hypothetical protein
MVTIPFDVEGSSVRCAAVTVNNYSAIKNPSFVGGCPEVFRLSDPVRA